MDENVTIRLFVNALTVDDNDRFLREAVLFAADESATEFDLLFACAVDDSGGK